VSLREAVDAAVAGREVAAPVLEAAFDEIMSGRASEPLIAALLTALHMKGETVSEIVAAARALRARAVTAKAVDPHTVDTCGTGGDGAATFNISTAAAFVVAGAGVPVAKHGNRAASSRAGSADVLEALGVQVDIPVEASARILAEIGVAPFFARRAHPAMREVALGPQGLCESLPKNAIHVVMGTHGVAMVRELELRHREAGQTLVAAPVLGRPDLAASGQLGIVVGGPEAAVARVQPLLHVMGRKTFAAGPKPESATAIKLANNAVLGCAMVAMAEGFSLIKRYAVPPQVFQDVMTEGLFSAPAYKIYGQKMVDESFDQVGSPISVGLKDARLIAEAGAATSGHARRS